MTSQVSPGNPGDTENLFPAGNLDKEYPHLFNERQAAYAIRNRANSGLESAFVYIGRRPFIDRAALVRWVYAQGAEV